jgi:CDP-diacylglycerol--serine O-phosphatidyltransferase
VAQPGPWQLHPPVLVFALSGSLMISKTLRIPKPLPACVDVASS